jgi:hypothetical protein
MMEARASAAAAAIVRAMFSSALCLSAAFVARFSSVLNLAHLFGRQNAEKQLAVGPPHMVV